MRYIFSYSEFSAFDACDGFRIDIMNNGTINYCFSFMI